MNFIFSKKTLHIFYVFVIGIFVIKIDSFTGERVGHASVVIGSKLYFFGGIKINSFCSDEIFYLDVSKTFSIESPPWVDLTIHVKMPFGGAMNTVSLVTINDEPIVYLFGGVMLDPITGEDLFVSNTHTFNPKTLEWKIPFIKGKEPERRNIRGASDDTGKIYIFSGFYDAYLYSNTVHFFDEMLILDTFNSTWSYSTAPNMPIRRAGYSATMLKNGVIVYIGGSITEQELTININNIVLYDTKLDTWSTMIATNTSLMDSRFFHSAVLDPDENIIVYGGRKSKVGFAKVEPPVIVLNTRKTPFEWTAPLISSNVDSVISTSGHTANLIGNYMIVAFGNITELHSHDKMYNSRMYIMDIRNYTWVETFEVIENTKNKTEESPTSTSGNITNKRENEENRVKYLEPVPNE
ncbi:uncharacterized protein OCT59_001639 [Rhizophagus irregularis]|uniref:Kel2p n=1 Tax=Rhizophagus irregularis (strain DAOM 197198w) TaxID=1432141 RepID=A0A015JH63_RHIIW|nr:Kel2p [Rhizophagus irregularis DAOM 197198w]EXX66460.1 Kel2p [Rhizophagus irregularis DAOM 197198w]EXX72265.1 Kel2p [Rhizophagus irregularis DAOM 197198w]UZO10041.1 hypothetical protein OCT59_001639 [Rhizophagus irregularis]CAG8534884.1 12157_t:CDS:2 [Rhizophagus irregularis]